MSYIDRFTYAKSKELDAQGHGFYTLLASLIHKADSTNLEKIRSAWPEEVDVYCRRYEAPGVVLPEEATAPAPVGTPKIFVFCNNCSPGWHSMCAIAEDGTALAGHLCSDHGYAAHDMGIDANGWTRDLYAAHYPNGFEVVWVENPKPGQTPEFDAACEKHLRRAVVATGEAP